jgi:stage V sporulation protein S
VERTALRFRVFLRDPELLRRRPSTDLHVATDSAATAVAYAVVAAVHACRAALLKAIGPAAANQAVKAVAAAAVLLEREGIRIGFLPVLTDNVIAVAERTVVRFHVIVLNDCAEPDPAP